MWPIKLSRVFEDSRPWLEGLQHCFSVGFIHRPKKKKMPEWAAAMIEDRVGPAITAFDDETSGGLVQYSTILIAVPMLTGALKGLVIPDPKFPSAPAPLTSTRAARTSGEGKPAYPHPFVSDNFSHYGSFRLHPRSYSPSAQTSIMYNTIITVS